MYSRDNNVKIIPHPVDRKVKYADKYGKCHVYYPDFYVVETNMLVEIKGDNLFLDRDPTKQLIHPKDRSKDYIAYAKWLKMKDMNVRIISTSEYSKYVDYVKHAYGIRFIGEHST